MRAISDDEHEVLFGALSDVLGEQYQRTIDREDAKPFIKALANDRAIEAYMLTHYRLLDALSENQVGIYLRIEEIFGGRLKKAGTRIRDFLKASA